MGVTKRGGARPGAGQPRKPADQAVSVRFSLALTPAEADEYRRRGAGPWVRKMLKTASLSDTAGEQTRTIMGHLNKEISMPLPTAKALRAAATSVAGARAMGVETSASKAAPAMLATAQEWLDANVDGAQFERRWQDLDAAASELRAALGVVSASDRVDAMVDVSRARRAQEEAEIARRHAAAEWADARKSTIAKFGDLVDASGAAVAVVERRGDEVVHASEYGRNMPGISRQFATTIVAEDGRTLAVGEWVAARDGEQQYVVTGNGLHPAGAYGALETSATSTWLPADRAEKKYNSDLGAEMAWEDAFAARDAARKVEKSAPQNATAPVGAMAAALAGLRRA